MDVGGYFVTQRMVFESLSDLVTYYRQDADDLCVTLKDACLNAEIPQTAGLSKTRSDAPECMTLAEFRSRAGLKDYQINVCT